jgi:hypothetical protein
MGCAALIILPIVAIIITGGSILNSLTNAINNIFNPPTTAQIYDSNTIVQLVVPLGQLVSVEMQLAKADITVNIQSGALNACGHSGIHVAQGAVQAGIDLLSFDEQDVIYDQETNTYTITLPAPQLTSCRIDYIRQYDQSTTVCGIDWDEVRQLAQFQAMNGFREDSISGGILERAEKNSETVMANFVQALTRSNVSIVFEEPESLIVPQSCVSQLPAGWVFNLEDNQWRKE